MSIRPNIRRQPPPRFHRARRRTALADIVLAALCIAASGLSQPDANAAQADAPAKGKAAPAEGRSPESRRELVVFAAASIKDVFARLAPRFEQDHPGVRVVMNAAGSQELRAQIEHGAPADVFASADRKQMDALQTLRLVGPAEIFTCNLPVVVLRSSLDPSVVPSFRELFRVERLVIGAEQVPIGRYTMQILDKAAAQYGSDFRAAALSKVVSRELNVRQVLAKVLLGEADAGIVYGSDLGVAPSKLRVLAIPPTLNVRAEYPIAALSGAPSADLAQAWIAWVKSPAGTAALQEAGFTSCPRP